MDPEIGATHSTDETPQSLLVSRHWPLPSRRCLPVLHRVKRVYTAVVTWVKGPEPPQIQRINAFFPQFQSLPFRFLDRYFPKRKHKFALLIAFYIVWLLAFVAVLHGSILATQIEGYGVAHRISCIASYWLAHT
jgi:hypothetical protein